MGELKSAWEIAMEKASTVGSLSPEELYQQKMVRFQQIGNGLALNYLNTSDLRPLEEGLRKLEGEERALVSRSVAKTLAEAIQLGDRAALEKVMVAFRYLKNDEEVNKTIALIEDVFEEFELVQQKKPTSLDHGTSEELSKKGISGNAIRAIDSTHSHQQHDLEDVMKPYEEKLAKLRQQLEN